MQAVGFPEALILSCQTTLCGHLPKCTLWFPTNLSCVFTTKTHSVISYQTTPCDHLPNQPTIPYQTTLYFHLQNSLYYFLQNSLCYLLPNYAVCSPTKLTMLTPNKLCYVISYRTTLCDRLLNYNVWTPTKVRYVSPTERHTVVTPELLVASTRQRCWTLQWGKSVQLKLKPTV